MIINDKKKENEKKLHIIVIPIQQKQINLNQQQK